MAAVATARRAPEATFPRRGGRGRSTFGRGGNANPRPLGLFCRDIFLPKRGRGLRRCLRRNRCPAPRRQKVMGWMSAKVFVGNLDFKTTKAEVQSLFSQIGEIRDVFLPMDRESGRPRGFAFVEFTSDEDAAKAIEKFNGYQLGGRALRVNAAEDRPRGSRPPGGGGGGGYRGAGG